MTNPILEVDESIIKKHLLLPETLKKDENIEKLFNTFDNNVLSKIITPNSGLVIKTKTDNNEKIFINICHTNEIPSPKNITEDELIKILDDEKPNWCIPMSVGHERYEDDKNGSKCLTYDIAINTNYFDKIKNEHTFFTFTVITMFSAVGEKNNRIIDGRNYVVLKNRKHIGKLHDHRVEKRNVKSMLSNTINKPLIEEINTTKNHDNNVNTVTTTITNTDYIILRKPKIGNAEKLIGYFKLPDECTLKDVKVDIGDDRIIIDSSKYNYLIDLFVPYVICQANVTAYMDQHLNVIQFFFMY